MDENVQLIFTNIDEEINDKMIPIVEYCLLILSEIRALIKSKQIEYNNQSALYLGLNESIIQSMIDYCGYYYYQL